MEIHREKIKSQILKEDNVYKVIFLSFSFSLLQCSYASFQEFLPIAMRQEDILFLANISLGTLYLAFCFSEFLISPYIFSLYKGPHRNLLFSVCSLTFTNMILSFSNVVNCLEYDIYNKDGSFFCNPNFQYPYCVFSSLLCGIGGSAIWLTQGIYMCKCCRPWNRGRFSGIFFLIFNTSLVTGNFMGYYILKTNKVILYYAVCTLVSLTASILFLFVQQPEALKKSVVGQVLVFKEYKSIMKNKPFSNSLYSNQWTLNKIEQKSKQKTIQNSKLREKDNVDLFFSSKDQGNSIVIPANERKQQQQAIIISKSFNSVQNNNTYKELNQHYQPPTQQLSQHKDNSIKQSSRGLKSRDILQKKTAFSLTNENKDNKGFSANSMYIKNNNKVNTLQIDDIQEEPEIYETDRRLSRLKSNLSNNQNNEESQYNQIQIIQKLNEQIEKKDKYNQENQDKKDNSKENIYTQLQSLKRVEAINHQKSVTSYSQSSKPQLSHVDEEDYTFSSPNSRWGASEKNIGKFLSLKKQKSDIQVIASPSNTEFDLKIEQNGSQYQIKSQENLDTKQLESPKQAEEVKSDNNSRQNNIENQELIEQQKYDENLKLQEDNQLIKKDSDKLDTQLKLNYKAELFFDQVQEKQENNLKENQINLAQSQQLEKNENIIQNQKKAMQKSVMFAEDQTLNSQITNRYKQKKKKQLFISNAFSGFFSAIHNDEQEDEENYESLKIQEDSLNTQNKEFQSVNLKDNESSFIKKKKTKKEGFFRQLLEGGSVFSEEQSFYNLIHKNKKKQDIIRKSQFHQEQSFQKSYTTTRDQQNSSFFFNNPSNFKERKNFKIENSFTQNSQYFNQSFTMRRQDQDTIHDMKVSQYDNNTLNEENQPVYAKDEEVLTLKDFILFLKHDDKIMNLVPSYIFSGLFFGFWQKLGPIMVQFTKQSQMELEYKNIYDDTGMVFIISGMVQFIIGPIFGVTYDRASKVNKRRIMIFITIISIITILLFPLPFINTELFYHNEEEDRFIGQTIFLIIGILFGIQNCGFSTTGGPIRSWAFNKERTLVLSFATYRFIYYFSIAFAFFCTIGIPYQYIPYFIPSVLIIFAIWTVKTLIFNHQY